MKKLITIILVLISGYIQAQQITYTPMTAAGYRFKYFVADSGHTVPFKDTALDRGTTRPGSLVCFTGDSSVYWWNGARWRPIGSNVTTGTITSGIDSATFYNGNLCFWTEGASECFDLTQYFCNSELNHDSTRILFYTCTGDLIDSVFLPIAYVDVDYPITKRQVGDTTYIGIDALQGQNGLLFGGLVSHDTLYTYDVTAAIYTINGTQYNSSSGSVTLDPADDDFDRQDIIALDTNGNIISITGTPGADPQLPQIDPLSQVFLTSVYVKAASTAPDNLNNETIYDENVEAWTRTNTSGLTVNPDNTTSPFHLLKSLDVGSWAVTKSVNFIRVAGAVPAGTYSLLKLFINLKAPLAANGNISVLFYNGATNVGNITLTPAQGFVKGTAGVYQNVTVPMTTSPVTQVVIGFIGVGGGAYIDYVQLQGGIPNGNSNFVTNVFRKNATDSVFKVINGVNVFAFIDSTGGGSNTLQEAYDADPLANPQINFRGNDVTFDSLQNTAFNFAGGDFRTVDFNGATAYSFNTTPWFPDYNVYHDLSTLSMDGNGNLLIAQNDSSQGYVRVGTSIVGVTDEKPVELTSTTTRSGVTEQHSLIVNAGNITINRQSGLDTTHPKLIIENVDTLLTAPTYVYVPDNDTLKVYPYPSGSSVTTVYQEIISTAAQTTFSFASVPAITSKYMIYVNGAAIPKTYYSVSSNDIIFSTGLVDGDRVIIQGIE